MFFDEERQDHAYLEMMRAIAAKQRELLCCHFDWQQRVPKPCIRRRLFGKSRQEIEYNRLLEELEELKRQALEHRRKNGSAPGTFWWKLPWEQVEAYLIYDLSQHSDMGSWRFARNWELEQEEERRILLLHEEGHCSDFSSGSSFETGIVSSLSQSEIDSRMRDFNRMANNYELGVMLLGSNTPVRSWSTGITYGSGAEYVLSAEHYFRRQKAKEELEQSLFTRHETTTLTVTSTSRHYEAVFAVAEFRADQSGRLSGLLLHNYALCASRGDLPSEISDAWAARDAAVGCAAWLADYDGVTEAPMALLGMDATEGAVDYQEAMRQAEICTCLAEKIGRG